MFCVIVTLLLSYLFGVNLAIYAGPLGLLTQVFGAVREPLIVFAGLLVYVRPVSISPNLMASEQFCRVSLLPSRVVVRVLRYISRLRGPLTGFALFVRK